MRYSDKLNVAVATTLTALAMFVSTFIGPNAPRWMAAMLAVIGAVFWVLVWVQGPRDVHVRFGDLDTLLGFWDRVVIRRTINRYYWFLVDLGFSPPTISPLIKIGHTDFGVENLCSAPGSADLDVGGLGRKRVREKVDIALAYSQCYFRSLLTSGPMDVNHIGDELSAVSISTGYFCNAFAGTPFIQNGGSTSITGWISAVISVRSSCGKAFADPVMAYAVKSLRRRRLPDESFDLWFQRALFAGMINTTSQTDRTKVEQAISILTERGVYVRS